MAYNDSFKINNFIKNHISLASVIMSAIVVLTAALSKYLYYVLSSTYIREWGISPVYLPEMHYNEIYIIVITLIIIALSYVCNLALVYYSDNRLIELVYMLFEITRNTGFETTKGKLGECFIIDCCSWEAREADDICGLDQNRLASDDKIKTIVEYSILKDSFAKAGL